MALWKIVNVKLLTTLLITVANDVLDSDTQ